MKMPPTRQNISEHITEYFPHSVSQILLALLAMGITRQKKTTKYPISSCMFQRPDAIVSFET